MPRLFDSPDQIASIPDMIVKGYDIRDLSKPFNPKFSAEAMYERFNIIPDSSLIIPDILAPARDNAFVLLHPLYGVTFRSGTVVMPWINDELGIVVGSWTGDRSSISAARLSCDEGHCMDNVADALALHRGATEVGLAIVGQELPSYINEVGFKIEFLDPRVEAYIDLIGHFLEGVVIKNINVHVHEVADPEQFVSPRRYTILADSMNPTQPLVHIWDGQGKINWDPRMFRGT